MWSASVQSFPIKIRRHVARTNIVSVNSGRPCVGLAGSQSPRRRGISEKAVTCWFPVAAHRKENVFRKVWPLVTLLTFAVVQKCCFCEKVPLGKSSQESWACCGFSKVFPRRLGQCWLISSDSKFSVKCLISAVFVSPGESFPTPAGVMAKDVLDSECRDGLGGRVASHFWS